MNSYPGTLIVIEGIDGCGKSTLLNNLTSILRSAGNEVVATKEPGGSQLGNMMRTLTQTQPVDICPLAEYLLFAADRAQHFQEVVIPALKRGAIVISDRMGDSSLVYQGYGRGLDLKMIGAVNNWAMQNKQPDITLYVKVDQQTAQQRLETRSSHTVFEKEKSTFMQRVLEGFDTLYTNRSDVITLDGTRNSDDVTQQAYSKLESCISPIQNSLNPDH